MKKLKRYKYNVKCKKVQKIQMSSLKYKLK